ncbi:Chromosome partition protein [Leuconostoc citreum LBAE E16]|uniref:chromosome segregation protein SMC n=1 Tax=Leuconostoc citreum TaxID=33964 RepID=UPI0002465D96|nr:chromosome segregation protein SMC [Leuconostoc citreum]CCF29180.1 Chromosome partition protein [Leuconostoc citreum LBAE E16]
MKLKSLEISGFKSFADKTIIEFMPGMTGIVGPNGSGKSNIIEAMRWVMGEQSAKDLRGTKMTDVIFGGTNMRGALNRAEVSMTFDNTDHYVNSDFSEIRITRKLYRSGDSSYQINGVESRLRDVHDLFIDTGLGRESFSIISQGRVESIFNAKPENRRAIIEEVAGVHKYKQNKDRAQKQLTQTRDNLARVADIIHEIQGRIDPLAEQSAQATDYLAQKERFEALNRLQLALTHHDLELKIIEATRRAESNDGLVNQDKTKLDVLNKALADKRQERISAQLLRDKLQQNILHDTQVRERLIGASNLSAQQIKSLNDSLTIQAQQITQLQSEQDDLTKKKDSLIIEKQKLTVAADELKTQLKKFDRHHQLAQQKDTQQKLEQNRHNYIEVMQDIATVHNTLQTEEKAKSNLTARLAKLTNQLESETAALHTLSADLPSSDSEQQTSQVLKDLQKALANWQQQIDTAEAKYQADEQNWYRLLSDLNKVRSQLDARNALDEYAGFYQGVRALMKPDIRQAYPGIQGVVAELLTVPVDYTLAIETALGGALQQVVVDTTDTAKQVISYLTKKRAGRVTILPMDTMKPRQLSGLYHVESISGFIGVAADLVTMPKDMRQIKSNLLGQTVIAKDLDAAIHIAKAGQHRFRVVTLDGQIINTGGSLTGGANQKQGATILSRQAEINHLNQQVAQLTAASQKQEKSLQEERKRLNALREASQAAETKYATAKNQVNQVDYELTRQQDALKQQQRTVDALKFELTDIKAQQADLLEKLVADEKSLQRLTNQKATLESEATELKTALAHLSEQSQVDQTQQTLVQTQHVTMKTRVDGLNEQLEQLTNQNDTVTNRLAALQAQHSAMKKQLVMAQDNDDHDAKVANISARLVQAENDFDKQTEQFNSLTDVTTSLEEQFEAQQANLRVHITAQSQTAAALARLETQLDNIKGQLLTQYDLVDISDVLGQHQVDELPEITSQLTLVKKSLDEIGSVNIGAITEYEEVKTRFDFLNQQRDDLQLASDTLLQTIDEMDEEVQVRFKATFDQIATHFSAVFSKMFGGGRAEIRLTDPKHLLTTGIDIIAQPPGKKFQQMSLLSGGEKALTAITLLFAILQVRPVPFVVLDEAEAALDEANVDRFAQYLYHFSGETQFIVITHRKGTMMKANLLYGVTMQEAGISKMIAVDLDKARESVG